MVGVWGDIWGENEGDELRWKKSHSDGDEFWLSKSGSENIGVLTMGIACNAKNMLMTGN